MKRRDFMIGTGAAGLTLASKSKSKPSRRQWLVPTAVKPLVISISQRKSFQERAAM